MKVGYRQVQVMAGQGGPSEPEQSYNNFAEGQDLIETIEGVAAAARHTGRGPKRKKVAPQNQVIVRWPPIVMHGWVVELAKQKGYHIDHVLQLMAHHDVCNTPNLPTVCCCPNAHLPARQTPARTTSRTLQGL